MSLGLSLVTGMCRIIIYRSQIIKTTKLEGKAHHRIVNEAGERVCFSQAATWALKADDVDMKQITDGMNQVIFLTLVRFMFNPANQYNNYVLHSFYIISRLCRYVNIILWFVKFRLLEEFKICYYWLRLASFVLNGEYQIMIYVIWFLIGQGQ